ncbi:hypothetical protein F5Y15DRAFT_391496 [Xylariaceae sp. FL0016]|nr:hypothetical protein F5Y15DRAFT_391496 [Xylariaceae sp. FL0016]
MFFKGSLQEGIQTALQQAKPVVCFATDGEAGSQEWENEFLSEPSVKSLLEARSIVLRLQAGSEEAGFLEAMFPVPKKPTVLILETGQLKEYLAAGTSKDEFIRRINAAFNSGSSQHAPQPIAAASNQQTYTNQPQASQNDDDLYDDNPSATQAPAPVPAPSVTASQSRTQQEQKLAAEQTKRAEDERKAKAAKEKADTEAQARRRDIEKSAGSPTVTNPEQSRAADEIKHRKQQANEERKRILEKIENDKIARKKRADEEKKARALLNAGPGESATNTKEPPITLSKRTPQGTSGDYCSLQIRLLDGSTIRNRFPSDKTLSHDVRKWVDEERTDGDAPYSFRIVLTPRPNKDIEPTREIESLLSIGLVPSATLILVPVKFTSAYSRAGGVVAHGANPIIGLFTSIYTAIMAMIIGLFGRRTTDSSQEGIPMDNLDSVRNSRIRSFQNPNDRRGDSQLYNGNSLNFEPRNDENEDETR